MAQVPSLMQRAKAGPGFKKPDVSQFVPKGMEDAVKRVTAAGFKLMYSPEMREELRGEIERDAPVPQKLAEAIVGLLLVLDKQSQGGIPMGALLPAAMELLGEGAEVLTAAGQPVSQEDFNEAARMVFVLMAKKLGASDDQVMQAARSAVPGGGQQMAEPDEGMEEAEEPVEEVERA